MDLKPNMANYILHRRAFLFGRKNVSEFTTKNSFREFGFFFCPKKMSYGVKKVRHVGF